jgi:hypothetical protein
MAEFSGFFESHKPPQWVIPAVSYWRIVMAIKTASKVGVFFIAVLLIAALVDARAICSE